MANNKRNLSALDWLALILMLAGAATVFYGAHFAPPNANLMWAGAGTIIFGAVLPNLV